MAITFCHVAYAAQNGYEAAGRILKNAGLASCDGGWNSRGIGYRIIPLGNSYFEIISIIDHKREQTANFDLTRRIERAGGNFFHGWFLQADTLAELQDIGHRVGKEVVHRKTGRISPDLSEVETWSIPNLESPIPGTAFTFFYWPEPDRYAGRAYSAAHVHRPVGLSWIELGGDEAAVRRVIGTEAAESLPIRFVGGNPGIRAVGILTGNGDVEIRAGPPEFTS